MRGHVFKTWSKRDERFYWGYSLDLPRKGGERRKRMVRGVRLSGFWPGKWRW